MAAAAGAPAAGPGAVKRGREPSVPPEDAPRADVLLTPAQWGEHLRADVHHDFPEIWSSNRAILNYYNAGETGGFRLDEDQFWDDVMSSDAIQNNRTFQNRLMIRRSFSMPTATGTYNTTAAPLVEGGNLTIGVVTDAGKYVTDYLGARNVISFGNCIDPAPSPVGAERNPIYFEPTRKSRFTINLEEFGFSPRVIESVDILDVSAGKAVKSVWNMADDSQVDPVMAQVVRAAEPGYKSVNKIEGYYGSIARAGDEDIQEYYIGKTLGDVMIVASTMPQLNGTNNPYYMMPGRGEWRNYMDNTVIGGLNITTIAMKTGDRLNALRSMLKGVPTILERLAKGDQPKRFDFYPAELDPNEVFRRLPAMYDILAAEARARYNGLSNRFMQLLDDTGSIRGRAPSCIRFVDESKEGAVGAAIGRIISRDETFERKRGIIGREIRRIAEKLQSLGDVLARHYEDTGRSLPAVDRLTVPDGRRPIRRARIGIPEPPGDNTLEWYINQYNSNADEINALSPQTTEVIRITIGEGDGIQNLLRPIVPVTRKESPILGPPMDIQLMKLFKAIDANPDDYRRSPTWISFNEHFPLPLPAVGPAAAGAPQAGGAEFLQDYVDMFTPPDGFTTAAPSTINVADESSPTLLPTSDLIPLTTAYIKFMGGNTVDILNQLHRLRKSIGIYMLETKVIQDIGIELDWLEQFGSIVYTAGENVGNKIDILEYNQFVSHINHLNATMDGQPDPIGFDEMVGAIDAKITELFREEAEGARIVDTGAVAPAGESDVNMLTPANRNRSRPARFAPPSAAETVLDEFSSARDMGSSERAPSSPTSDVPPSPERPPAPPSGGRRTPRRKNRKSTYRLKKKPSK